MNNTIFIYIYIYSFNLIIIKTYKEHVLQKLLYNKKVCSKGKFNWYGDIIHSNGKKRKKNRKTETQTNSQITFITDFTNSTT
jgi:hypothetical protein